ncbi:MAG: hypothetical protein JST59_00320 [Actinobacteria bacterium]|nr:hypothetical protein [Actinomycetota bacterium]
MSEVNWSEKDMQKSQLSSQQDRLLRNSYEVAISNLNSQMNGLRTKLEGLQLRYDIKCRELKEKDAFVRNVIVTRVGRDANTSDLQYFSHKLDEFMASPRSLGRN